MSSLVQIGKGFWNLRVEFYVLYCLDIGTHMGLIQLDSGKFIALDTVKLTPTMKDDIDSLTNNGELLEAVIATHPYHTIFFSDFYKHYPNAKYYGTKRHLQNIKDVKWEGNILEENNMKRWEDQGVQIRVPDGADLFDDTHFSGLFVFHAPSKTIFNDDTIMYFNKASFPLNMLAKSQRFSFHLRAKDSLNTPDGPIRFKSWFDKLLNDWDFDNICVAHHGHKIGGVKEALRDLLKAQNTFF